MVGMSALIERKKETYFYHSTEHMMLNCIDAGDDINLENARKRGRLTGLCGATYASLIAIFTAVAGSVVLTAFPVENEVLRGLVRVGVFVVIDLLLKCLIYWLLWCKNKPARLVEAIISAPGKLIQRFIVTKEPRDEHIEVAIAAAEELAKM